MQENYAGLSDKELLEFLAEIKGDDEEQQDDIDALESSLPDEPEAIINKAEPTYIAQVRRIGEIKRAALNQTDIDLSAIISNECMTMLIELSVRKDTAAIDKYSVFINKRFTKLLMPFIPLQLRKAWMAFPGAFRPYPGFLYTASKEYGDSCIFWVTPDIPCYLKQGSEVELIKKNSPVLLIPVDELIKRYYKRVERRTDREIANASSLVYKNVKTYYDLLKAYPRWFQLLYEHITKKDLLWKD